ncbi:MAG: hypothetical protein ACNA7J_08660 [Wenzhouxiangella sp.]
MILIGIAFLAAAGMKLADPGSVVDVFASWGVSSPVWIPVAAWIEVAIGLSLLNVLFGSVVVPTVLLWLAVIRSRRPGLGLRGAKTVDPE